MLLNGKVSCLGLDDLVHDEVIMAIPLAAIQAGITLVSSGLDVMQQRAANSAQRKVNEYQVAADKKVQQATNIAKAERGKYLRFTQIEEGNTAARNLNKLSEATAINLNIIKKAKAEGSLTLSVKAAEASGELLATAGSRALSGRTIDQLNLVIANQAATQQVSNELTADLQAREIVEQFKASRESQIGSQGVSYDIDGLDFYTGVAVTPEKPNLGLFAVRTGLQIASQYAQNKAGG